MEKFETETHSQNIDTIYNQQLQTIDNVVYETTDLFYILRVNFRLYRKKLSLYLKRNSKQLFQNILYITTDKPPLDYMIAFQKQYPDKKFKVLVPITKLDGLSNPIFNFNFYIQNKKNNATLYHLPKNNGNIEVLGLYSDAWCNGKFQRLQYLAPFMKAVRICVKKLKPNIVHSEHIPFFLGSEFEPKSSYGIKVFQTVKDFSLIEMNKTETFWAAINLVDKVSMRKICRDKIIKRCIASLFNLHNTKRIYKMRECLDFIYQNYSKFRRYVDKCEDIDENILFNRLNARIVKLFPQMAYEEELFYNSMYYTLKKADAWAVTSKTYYEALYTTPEISGNMYKRIESTKRKSHYIIYGCSFSEEKIYQPFDTNNFRELREKNKNYLLKEFSKDRIRTNFIDSSLFKNENYIIKGFLDSFYAAPLLFSSFTPEIFSQGVDIAFSSIFKLFDMNKNIQVIINVPNGLKQKYINNAIELLERTPSFNGRWLFVDGEINLAQFYASSDIAIFSKRLNSNSTDHYLAMKYGCIPVALRNGIYNDTIIDIFDDMANGCGFKTQKTLYTSHDASDIYFHALIKALNLYTQNSSGWNILIKNALDYNSEWTFELIEKYNKIYDASLVIESN